MWCAIYLCCLIVAGYPVAAGLARGATRMETLAMTMCIGPGVMGICLIFLSMLGVRPVSGEILAIAAVFGIAGIVVWRSTPKREILDSSGDSAPKWWAMLCFVGIGYGLYAVGSDALINPVIEWDAFAIWQMKAQVLAILPLHPRPGYFTDLNLSYSHLRYPLLAPMISAGMHAMTGNLDDLGKIISLLWYLGMEFIVFAAVKRLNGTTAALTAAALLACTEPMARYGGTGTAEMPLTAFYACSVVCILRWRETWHWGYLMLAALFGAWMAWTKIEGLALAAVNAFVVAACGRGGNWKKSITAAAIMAAVVGIFYAPWIAYSWGLPRTDEDYAGRLNVHEFIHHLDRLGTVVSGIGLELINWEDWGLFWIIAAFLAIWQRRRFKNESLVILAMLLVLHLLAYVPPLVVTNWNVDELMPVTLGRFMMHAAPAGAILIGGLWPGWFGGGRSAAA